jgi:hypothetical protein
MIKEISITKPNVGNNYFVVCTLHREMWILHMLLQLYAYRDLFSNLFADSVVCVPYISVDNQLVLQSTNCISCERKKVPSIVSDPDWIQIQSGQ